MSSDSEGRIVRLHDDRHQALQDLLPWYATGALSGEERAELDAHLPRCGECQAELRFQRALKAEVAALPLAAADGWQAMLRQLRPELAVGRFGLPRPALWLGAAAATIILGVAALVAGRLDQPAGDYHLLGARPTTPPGNALAIFRPDITEAALRKALRASGARLVGGPTDSDAYILQIAPADRTAALARLRAAPGVVMAEPVDPSLTRR